MERLLENEGQRMIHDHMIGASHINFGKEEKEQIMGGETVVLDHLNLNNLDTMQRKESYGSPTCDHLAKIGGATIEESQLA